MFENLRSSLKGLCLREEPFQIIKNLARTAIWARGDKMEVANFTVLKVEHMAGLLTVCLYLKADNYGAI
jgi:hypothetical protein